MYARYIPPAAGQTAPRSQEPASAPAQSRASAPAPASTSTSAPATTVQVSGDGFSYSRYIPGAKQPEKKPEATKIQYFDDEPSSPKPKRKREEEEAPQESRSKKSKKTKGRKDADADAAAGAVEEEVVEQVQDKEPDVSEKKSKKSKKNKDKNKDDAPEEVEEIDRSVKKAKKSKKKDKSKEEVSDEAEEEPVHPESAPVEIPDSKSDAEIEAESSSKKDRKKSKKSSKEKKSKQEPQVEEESDVIPEEDKDTEMADADASMLNEDTDETMQLEPKDTKEKKVKKEKKKKSQDTTSTTEAPEEEQEDEEDQRHRAVFERKAKSLRFAIEAAKAQDAAAEPEEPEELHGLEPLPQPEQAAPSTAKPTYDTLPSWLSAPIRVSQDTRTPFTQLGVLPRPARVLEEKGYAEAFAVQTAALPLLLPTSKHLPGDLLISAATGSGKTLAYALPIVRDLGNGVVTRLRALVVLPTRELVKQAQEVFELCARAYEGEDRKRVRVGVAIGSQSMASEQDNLVGSETRYDPETYRQLEEQRANQAAGGTSSSDLDDILTGPGTEEKDPRIGPWQGQVVDFSSKVDVLICTPGRLVEHIEQTPGFSLDYVRWLVVDEADKLLAQSFQGWLDVVLERFRVRRFSARDFPDAAHAGVRKVILSATLTRDLSLLNQLALRRPRLIVLEREDGDVQVAEHSLPGSLREFAVRVHDANLKPLYLLDLLRSEQMAAEGQASGLDGSATEAKDTADSDSDSDTSSADSDSDSGSDSDSDTSSSGSDTTSDSDSDSDSDSSSDEEKEKEKEEKGSSSQAAAKSKIPMSLIFTKSNESALRLSRLLILLDKSLAAHISTLTSTTPTSIRRKTLRAFMAPSSPLRLIIASDLVARGIDIPKLSHVINYDLPPSVAGYVHRVGRTARAGRSGCAWTLVGDGESGWFWGKIAKGAGVRRAQKVERVRIEEMSEERIEEYEGALEKLGKEALESRRR